VASKVGGLPEIIEDGVTGFVCSPDDVDGMVERGVRLLQDGELHRTMAREAAHMVRAHYCTELIVPRYEAEYERVLAGAAQAAAVGGRDAGAGIRDPDEGFRIRD
jgi:glycosyltransferase involved in cell wall biosynthesis